MGEVRLLLKCRDIANYDEIAVYEAHGGYQVLRKALQMERQAVIDEIKKTQLATLCSRLKLWA